MESQIILNYFNEPVEIIIENSYDGIREIVMEARAAEKDLRDGEFRVCTFKKLDKHNTRPGLVILIPNHKPLIMVVGTTKYNDDWKQYEDNILIRDWKVSHLRDESYASTYSLFGLEDVIVDKSIIGKITKGDYNRIVEPTIRRILQKETDSLFESLDFEGTLDMIKEDLDQ